MPTTHKTEYQIKLVMKHNRDGTSDKQQDRHQNLMDCVRRLQVRGYGQRWDLHKIGKKEVSRLVSDWRDDGIGNRRIANRLGDIRWLASKVNRSDQIPTNKEIGVGLRKNQAGYGENKAVTLQSEQLEKLDARMQIIIELKAEFGLREKEAIKFQHKYAVQEPGKIMLYRTWTKGGRPRDIPIVNDRQRALLERVKNHQLEHKEKSMIPRGMKYKTYKNKVQEQSTKLGIKGHGLRHRWAQTRFAELSGGIKPPMDDGPKYSALSDAEKERWDVAAKQINEELGHGEGRQDITATYIGARG